MDETNTHIRLVQGNINQILSNLMERSRVHDASKLSEPEKSIFEEAYTRLRKLKYGSSEYSDSLKELKVAIHHHYKCNSHHPEHFGKVGMMGMSLLDLIEMFADWKAAIEKHDDGDFETSLFINEQRFKIPPELMDIFVNTALELGWI